MEEFDDVKPMVSSATIEKLNAIMKVLPVALLATAAAAQGPATSRDCAVLSQLWSNTFGSALNTVDCCDTTAVAKAVQGGAIVQVKCNNATTMDLKRVVVLDLGGTAQTLPSGISQLSGLQKIVNAAISGASIGGTIPTELGLLQQLTWLELTGNKFSGGIPSELGNLAQLSNLNLANNGLSGTVPTQLAQLNALQTLQLSTNNLNGTFPSAIASIPALVTLKIDHNLFSGTTPTNPKSNFNMDGSYNCFTDQGLHNTNCDSPSSAGPQKSGGVAQVSSSPGQGGDNSGGGSNMGAIIGGAAGGVIAILVGVGAAFYFRKNPKVEPKSVVPLRSYDAEFGPSPAEAPFYASSPATYQNAPNGAPSRNGSFIPPYAGSEGGISATTDPRAKLHPSRAVQNLIPSSDGRSSHSYPPDEKVSLSGNQAFPAEPSFLDAALSRTGRGTSPARGPGSAQLDEKGLLRAAGIGAAAATTAPIRGRPEAAPLPDKNAQLFQPSTFPQSTASSFSTSNDPGPLPEKDPLLFQVNSASPGGGASTARPNPSAWSVEEVASWASKIERIGDHVAAKIREHGINGDILLQITREDMRTDFNLTKLGDRAVFEEELKKLKASAGILEGPVEVDAPLPPSYNNLFM
ncbi:hypothetical protein BC830DRAFT_32000 [Chytriomyces sp. MP71]|nr:hypothetical protein BC830DRAFT_32000 [Chytriomyces sp. MP71]